MALIATAFPHICSAGQKGIEDYKTLMENTTPEERATFQTEMMAEKLGLTATQQDKIQSINLRYVGKISQVVTSQSSRLKKFRTMKSIRSDKENELKAVLTDQQFATYQKNKEEMRAKLKEKHNR